MTHFPQFTVQKFMTLIPYTVEPGMSVRVALELMRRHGVRHLPVEDSDRIVGVLSDWDIVAASRDGTIEKVLDLNVANIMTPDPVTVSPSMPLDHVIALMDRDGIGSVLVSERGTIVGIFTEKDAIHAFAMMRPYEGDLQTPAMQ